MNPRSIQTFEQRVEWCRRNHRAWTDGKPGPIATMEGHLAKHILCRFGDRELSAITETDVQEFIADLKRPTFERRRKNGELVKTYRLARKSVLNIVGVVKLILGRKAWLSWDLDVGKPVRARQRYFTEENLRAIVNAAEGQYKMLFALLAETGLRFGEAAGLHVGDIDLDNGVIGVSRSVWNGQELSPKTASGIREVDIDANFAGALKRFIGERSSGRLFQSRNGTPLSGGNVRKRILFPLLEQLGLPRAGLHAFRHSRVTVLRKRGTPGDLQRKWVGHSSLTTTDRYSHTDEELEYRREAAQKAGIGLLDPN